jgi:hypothetical protein
VTINGAGFTGTTKVTFGAVTAIRFTVVSDSQITAVSPAGPSGSQAHVRTTNPAGTSATSTHDLFTYTS